MQVSISLIFFWCHKKYQAHLWQLIGTYPLIEGDLLIFIQSSSIHSRSNIKLWMLPNDINDFHKRHKKPTSPVGGEENPQGAHSLSGFFYVTTAQTCRLYVWQFINTMQTNITMYIWMGYFLEAKSGVLKMKCFFLNKMEALSVKVWNWF